MQLLLDILAQFGGGRGDPLNNSVRFLLASFFWTILLWTAMKEFQKNRNRKDLYVAIASLCGLVRELFMFSVNFSDWAGLISHDFSHRFYPPLEHALSMFSVILIAYAFMRYFIKWRRWAKMYLIVSGAATIILYTITAIEWVPFLKSNPDAVFGQFWGDMAFRVVVSVLLGIMLYSLIIAKKRGDHVPIALYLAFAFFFLDEFLMVFNLATGEVYKTLYAPIRHNLHIWAIPLLISVYWRELNQRLSETERLKDNIFKLSPNVLFVAENNGGIKLSSPASRSILGIDAEKLKEKGLKDLGLSEDDLKSLRDKGTLNIQSEYKTDEGQQRWLQWNIQTSSEDNLSYGIVRDITEEKRLHEEIVKRERLESLNLLAGGIAHDFNNILTGVLGYISLTKMQIKEDKKIAQSLEKAEMACLRAKDLTQQLLTFTKGGAPLRKPTDIKGLIEDTVSFYTSGTKVKPIISLPDDLWFADIDESQISQAIGNLVINAVQAMPDGGRVWIEAENRYIKDGDDLPLKEGKYIVISVRDEGHGIKEENLKKIFDPFFTTKETGSGIGLASTLSIITRHDGYISVSSTLGKGTTFYVYLPASEQEIQHKGEEKEIDEIPQTGEKKALVMDDEEIVGDVLCQMLEHLGYKADLVKEGNEAFRLYRDALNRGEPYDVVILDLTVQGGMGGRETIERLLDIDPQVKAVVSSGYFNDTLIADYKRYGFYAAITKPYKLETLAGILKGLERKTKGLTHISQCKNKDKTKL